MRVRAEIRDIEEEPEKAGADGESRHCGGTGAQNENDAHGQHAPGAETPAAHAPQKLVAGQESAEAAQPERQEHPADLGLRSASLGFKGRHARKKERVKKIGKRKEIKARDTGLLKGAEVHGG